MFETVRLEREETEHGVVAHVTLDRPEVRNAIDLTMIRELGAIIDDLAADDAVRVAILAGEGGKAFAAGADIAQLKERGASDALRKINAALFRRWEDQPIPTIAAIRGWALGGGCELAMACDLRVAGEGAKLGQPEVGLGILPGAGAIQRLPRLVGIGKAKELIFTGRIIGATEAQQIGLVNQVVPDDQVLAAARELAMTIAKQGTLAVRISKMALNAAGRPNPGFESLDAIGQAVCFESEDKHRRMQAFLDKRKNKAKKDG
jgi:enoyl-CoA hydratase